MTIQSTAALSVISVDQTLSIGKHELNFWLFPKDTSLKFITRQRDSSRRQRWLQ